jgi:hypothetical protein
MPKPSDATVFSQVDVPANDERIRTPTRMPLPRPVWIGAEHELDRA